VDAVKTTSRCCQDDCVDAVNDVMSELRSLLHLVT